MEKDKNQLTVVGIGASAGGLDAIQQLFDSLPDTSGLAFVVIQHLSPDFKSMMPELLSKHTRMAIFTARDGQLIEPNCIYLNQSGKNLMVKDNHLHLLDKGSRVNLNLPVDIFFHSLGQAYQENSVGIILSGTGSDGSRGIVTIKEAGGITFVQDPRTAQFDGMPNSSISTNQIDFVLSPREIGEKIIDITSTTVDLTDAFTEKNLTKKSFTDILEHLYRKTTIDFRRYKRNTLIRRIEKRLHVHNLTNLTDYYRLLIEQPKETDRLKQDFLIGVSGFFRDNGAFESIKTNVIPKILNEDRQEIVRIWIPACSTGEEAYSLAIMCDQYIKDNNLSIDFKIFATDVDPYAVEKAGLGSFNINKAEEIPNKFLENYFIKTGESIQINKRIREKIIFSQHDILKDPPFLRMDLVSCRNMLIYFGTEAQQKVLHSFRFSLKMNGYLFLGNSESLGNYSEHFDVVDPHWKIFQSIDPAISTPPSHADRIGGLTIPARRHSEPTASLIYDIPDISTSYEPTFESYLGRNHAPSSIFIDARFNVLYTQGNIINRIKITEGVFKSNLLKMVPATIASSIRNGIRKLQQSGETVLIKNVRVHSPQESFEVDLQIQKVSQVKPAAYLVLFHEERQLPEGAEFLDGAHVSQSISHQIEDLEFELERTREQLQNVVEKLETSNEELQSSNEELMASNEELQSTNEELQSVNEELYTVNTELQEKNKELTQVTNEMDNLLKSTDIGTLFLDSSLNIRKFTPSLSKHFSLQKTDLGRPISSFTSTFKEEDRIKLITDCKICIETLSTVEEEIEGADGNIYFRRVSPFRTTDNKIEGVVITFVDITKLKQAEQALQASEHRFESLFNELKDAFVYGNVHTKGNKLKSWAVKYANPMFAEIFGTRQESEVREKLNDLELSGEHKTWRDMLYSVTKSSGGYITEEGQYQNKRFLLKLFVPNPEEYAILLSDITEQKEIQERLEGLNNKLALANSITNVAVWEWDVAEDTVISANEVWKDIYDLPRENVSKHWNERFFNDDERKAAWVTIQEHIDLKTDKYSHTFRMYDRAKKNIKWIKNTGKVTAIDSLGNPAKILGASVDITEDINQIERLRNERKFIARVMEILPNGVSVNNISNGSYIFQNKRWLDLLGIQTERTESIDFQKRVHPEDLDLYLEQRKNALNGVSSTIEIRVSSEEQPTDWVWMSSGMAPFEKTEDRTTLVHVLTDVDLVVQARQKQAALMEELEQRVSERTSELADTNMKLEESLAKEKDLNTIKSRFVATVSHQFRTPLSVIKSNLGLLNLYKEMDETKYHERAQELMDRVVKASNNMNHLMDDLLELEKINSKMVHVDKSPTDMVTILKDALMDIEQIQDDNRKAVFTIEGTPADVETDALLISQCAANLLSNAFKYSQGCKEPGCTLTFTEERVKLTIKDYGIGIPEKDQQHLFTPFFRASNVLDLSGSGMGLSIVKEYVQLLGGELVLKSEENKGVEVTIDLPIKA